MLLLLALACTDAPTLAPAPGPQAAGLQAWLEFADTASLPEHVSAASELGLGLRVAVKQGTHDREYVETLCAETARLDVPLVLWPLLDEAAGYWPNQSNAAAFADWALAVDDQAGDCPTLTGLVVDMEMPIDRMAVLSGGGLSMAERLDALRAGVDPEGFAAAKTTYADLVETLHGRGRQVQCSTLPMVVDDHLDGDEDIARALWTPVEGVGWDRLSFQVYRTLFAAYAESLLGADPGFGPGLVGSYAADIVAAWPDQAAVDLGTTGRGVVEHGGMTDPVELQEDIAAALAAGIALDAVHVYSLEGLLEHPDPAAWVATPAPAAGGTEVGVGSVRTLIQGLDGLL